MMRFGVGLGVMAMVLGVSASAVADESTSAKAKEADATVEAKDDNKGELDDLSVGTEDLKGKKNKQVAQAASATTGNTQLQKRPEEEDVPEEKEKPNGIPARIPWRGTAIGWSNAASASVLGLGGDFQSSDFQTYTQTFSASLNYFVIDQKTWSLAVQASPSFNVELTNSAATTRRNEPWMNDLMTQVVYRSLLYATDDGNWAAGLVAQARGFFPTSPASYNSGTYFRTAPGLIMWQSIPLIPQDVAPVLNSVSVVGVARWTHRFGAATTGVNGTVEQNVPRQGLSNTSQSVGEGAAQTAQDQLTGGRAAQNTLSQAILLFFTQPIGPTLLQFSTGFAFAQSWLPPFSDNVQCPGNVLTGCGSNGDAAVDASVADGRDLQYSYGFFAGGSYFPVPELGITFGYDSNDNQLGPSGQRQNIFYNPRSASFNLGLALSLDAIYEVITGPRRLNPFVLVAKNEKKNDKERTQPRKGIRNPTGL